jgi:hypothetical protein
MTTEKPVIGKTYSVNESATALNAAGQTVSAKDVLCAEGPAAILALNAAEALTTNTIVKWVLSAVVMIVQALLAQFCPNAAK